MPQDRTKSFTMQVNGLRFNIFLTKKVPTHTINFQTPQKSISKTMNLCRLIPKHTLLPPIRRFPNSLFFLPQSKIERVFLRGETLHCRKPLD
jgi:hypothetical protein